MNEFEIKNGLSVFWREDLESQCSVKYGVKFQETEIPIAKITYQPEHWKMINVRSDEMRQIVMMQVSRWFDDIGNYLKYMAVSGGEKIRPKDLVLTDQQADYQVNANQ